MRLTAAALLARPGSAASLGGVRGVTAKQHTVSATQLLRESRTLDMASADLWFADQRPPTSDAPALLAARRSFAHAQLQARGLLHSASAESTSAAAASVRRSGSRDTCGSSSSTHPSMAYRTPIDAALEDLVPHAHARPLQRVPSASSARPNVSIHHAASHAALRLAAAAAAERASSAQNAYTPARGRSLASARKAEAQALAVSCAQREAAKREAAADKLAKAEAAGREVEAAAWAAEAAARAAEAVEAAAREAEAMRSQRSWAKLRTKSFRVVEPTVRASLHTARGDTCHTHLLTLPPLVPRAMPTSPYRPWCHVAGAHPAGECSAVTRAHPIRDRSRPRLGALVLRAEAARYTACPNRGGDAGGACAHAWGGGLASTTAR